MDGAIANITRVALSEDGDFRLNVVIHGGRWRWCAAYAKMPDVGSLYAHHTFLR
jgi:hypothetical protein